MNKSGTSTSHSLWLTAQEAAKLLGCSRQYVVNLVDSAKLSSMKPGTRRRIKLSAILDFITVEDRAREKGFKKLIAATDKMGGYRSGSKSTK